VELINRKELSEKLKINSQTIARWHKEGLKVPYIRIGHQYRYDIDTILEWIKKGMK
jgi:DNA-binding transcriptional MerR regulator